MMEDLQRRDWDVLSGEARRQVFDVYEDSRSGIGCLARLIVAPSFRTLENWRILRRSSPDEPGYLGAWMLWHQERDLERVYEPATITLSDWRLRGRGLSPTIEAGEVELPTDAVERFLAEMSGVALPLYTPAEHFGCDGTSYQLRLGGFFAGVEYTWWEDPPLRWRALSDITTAFRALFPSG